jgi:predicted amino acid racemase
MRIVADCDKIRANARAIVDLCAEQGIEIAAVTKSVCGEPQIVRAVLAGGVKTIAESRIDNVRRIRDAGIDCDILMLRLPALSEADDVVALTQCSLNSEPLVLEALSDAAVRQGRIHDVIVIIESGDRREGVMPEDAVELCRLVLGLPGLDLAGVATSLNCLCGVMPTIENQRAFAGLVEMLEAELGAPFRIVSGGHTNNLQYVMSGEIPGRVTQLRVGEGIIFGSDVVSRIKLPSPHLDTFKVYAEVIELKDKPSLPEGPLGPDAFMRTHDWPDLGVRKRAVLAMGEIDLSVSFLKPAHAGVSMVGASSDHTVVDVTDADPPVAMGDELEFDAEYTAIAVGWSSVCTTKIVKPLSI